MILQCGFVTFGPSAGDFTVAMSKKMRSLLAFAGSWGLALDTFFCLAFPAAHA
jgi:hypothetical protein